MRPAIHKSGAYTAVVKPESVRTNGKTVVENQNPPCPLLPRGSQKKGVAFTPFCQGGVKKKGAAFTPFNKGGKGDLTFSKL